MGQQPNIELEIADLPRPRAHPAAARRWTPSRPGEMSGPHDVPWGGAFGTTGPDTGYALSLIGQRELVLAHGEHRANAEAAIAAVAGARASHYGRAPTGEDVDVALILFGYDDRELPADLAASLAADRVDWFANVAHDATKLRGVVAAIPLNVLASKPGAVRAQMATGRRLIQR
jgi:hypothetical protein